MRLGDADYRPSSKLPGFQSVKNYKSRIDAGAKAAKKQRINHELKLLGVSAYARMRSESRQLPMLLHDNEHIMGVVYGHHEDGFAMLIATDIRALFIDKKPFFMKTDELSYNQIGGVGYGKVGPFATVTLNTRFGNYAIRTLNFASAMKFIDFIEHRCLKQSI